jgi:multisubunit Na+/H+ antiporter MnhF subunit
MEEEFNHLAFFLSIIRLLVGPNYSDNDVEAFEVEIFLVMFYVTFLWSRVCSKELV